MSCKKCSKVIAQRNDFKQRWKNILGIHKREIVKNFELRAENSVLKKEVELWMGGKGEISVLDREWRKIFNIPKNKRTKKQSKTIAEIAGQMYFIEAALDRKRAALSKKAAKEMGLKV